MPVHEIDLAILLRNLDDAATTRTRGVWWFGRTCLERFREERWV